jgi:hypothetical protein
MLTRQPSSTEEYKYIPTDFGNIAYRETGSGPRGAIPGAGEVVELEGAKLFLPWERPSELATALREFWR